MKRWILIIGTIAAAFLFLPAQTSTGKQNQGGTAEARKVLSPDGVEIVYSILGHNKPALVFIHGGFAERGFWVHQVNYFGDKYQVITIDLAGHGESGKNREEWNLKNFGLDVCAVLEKEKIEKAVLIGNSMGGPVALEAARVLKDKIVCIVAADTFQGFSAGTGARGEYYKKMAASLRSDFTGTIRDLVRSLFHPDVDPGLLKEVEQKMIASTPAMGPALMESFITYDNVEIFKNDTHPIRCINGDLYPTNTKKNQVLHPDFEAVILPHTGHYPMLERPEHFNRHLEAIIKNLEK